MHVTHACRMCKMRANLLHINLHFASNTVFCAFFLCSFVHEHGKWREAWKLEKRSVKGYEVEKKGQREHLKADFGNMQGQHTPKIVAVTAGFCLTYP